MGKFIKLSRDSISVQQMHSHELAKTEEGTQVLEQMPNDDFISEPAEMTPPDTKTASIDQTLLKLSIMSAPSNNEDLGINTGQDDQPISPSHRPIHGDEIDRLPHESAVVPDTVPPMERSMSLLSIASATSITSGTSTKRKKSKAGPSVPSRTKSVSVSKTTTTKGRKGISKVDMKLVGRNEN